MYLRPEPGYLFIPVIVDTLNRIGISRKILLDDNYINLLEQIGHIAALEEANIINKEEAIDKCIVLTKEKAVNKNYYNALLDYMNGGTTNFISKLVLPFKPYIEVIFFYLPSLY
jgi:hypothetical protein